MTSIFLLIFATMIVQLNAMEDQITRKPDELIYLVNTNDQTTFPIIRKHALTIAHIRHVLNSTMRESIENKIELQMNSSDLSVFGNYLTLIGKNKHKNYQEIINALNENRKPVLVDIKKIVYDDLMKNIEIIGTTVPSLLNAAEMWNIDELIEPVINCLKELLNEQKYEVEFLCDKSPDIVSGFHALQIKNIPHLCINECIKNYFKLVPELIEPLLPSLQEKLWGYIPYELKTIANPSDACILTSYDQEQQKLIVVNPHSIQLIDKHKTSPKNIFDSHISTMSTSKTAYYDEPNKEVFIGCQQGIIKDYEFKKARFNHLITSQQKKAILALALHREKKVVVHGGNDQQIYVLNRKENKITASCKIQHAPVYAMNFLNGDLVFGTEKNCGFWHLDHEKKPQRYLNNIEYAHQTINPVKTIIPFDGKSLFLGVSNVLKLIDIRDITQSLIFQGHTRTILSIVPLEQQVISGGYDKTVRVWDIRKPNTNLQEIKNNSPITTMTFDHAHKELYIGAFDGAVKKCSLTTDPIKLLDYYKETFKINSEFRASGN